MLIPTAVSSSIRDASDFVELCALYGYYAEEHVVQTGDGYLLCLHRLAWRKGEENQKVNSGPKSVKKNVVYLHHGLLMNSEVWVCLTDEQRCLPFTLVKKGYDVWVSMAELLQWSLLKDSSSETIEETSIPRSPFTTHQQISNSGISRWTNSPSMTSQTASNMSSKRPPHRHFPI
jgi:hypothetical protein